MNRPENRQLVSLGFGVIVAAIIGVLACAVLTLPAEAPGLSGAVERQLDQAGVKNPVTAVLLNFRGYDTLLEITVLLLAVLGARALVAAGAGDQTQRAASPINPVLLGFMRVIAPVMILVAGYLLWVGGHAPGGAFQAGAVLAALGVLLKLGGVNWTQRITERGEQLLLVAGLAVFLAVGVSTMWGDRQLLEWPPRCAKWLILFIEAFAALSIAAILVTLFCCGTLRNVDQSLAANQRSGEE